MIGVLLILNSRGDIVMSRAFRDNFNIRVLAENFRNDVIAAKKVEHSPLTVIDKVCYLHLRYESLFFLVCTNNNLNCMMAFQYLIRLLQVLVQYFGVVDQEKLKDNFVTVQELIDETMDFGYPQMTEIDVLKSYITPAGTKADVLKRQKESEQVTIKATGKIPWRKDGIVYAKNEVFLEVIESVSLLLSQTGQVLQSEVNGRIMMKGFLSGMPECKLCLNDKLMADNVQGEGSLPQVELDDVTFHTCVRLGKFDSDRSICFVPPDGEFALMRYRTSGNVTPPLSIVAPRVKDDAKSRLEIDFQLKADFPRKLHATDVEVKVPCPPNTANVTVSVASGKAKYDPTQQAIIWKIRKLQGDSVLSFSAQASLIASTLQDSSERQGSRPPVRISFELPTFAASGLSVVYLKVTEPRLNYGTVRWVDYRTTADEYQCRI